MHDVQVFWFLSATFTLLTNLTWFTPTYLRFSRLRFDQLCTRSVYDDKKRRVLKIHCVRLKMKHSSLWLFYRTKRGQEERGDTSRGRTIKGSVDETQRFPFIFNETLLYSCCVQSRHRSWDQLNFWFLLNMTVNHTTLTSHSGSCYINCVGLPCPILFGLDTAR